MEIMKLCCEKCGGNFTKHKVVSSHNDSGTEVIDDEYNYSIDWGADYSIVTCLGCESVRFIQSEWCSDDFDPSTGRAIEHIQVFPKFNKNKRQSIIPPHYHISDSVKSIYSETLEAINAGINILGAGGFRYHSRITEYTLGL